MMSQDSLVSTTLQPWHNGLRNIYITSNQIKETKPRFYSTPKIIPVHCSLQLTDNKSDTICNFKIVLYTNKTNTCTVPVHQTPNLNLSSRMWQDNGWTKQLHLLQVTGAFRVVVHTINLKVYFDIKDKIKENRSQNDLASTTESKTRMKK